jgi:glycosyltransferase involved in cell wall biosynthesis
LRAALCLALPSRREGYGRVVVEAAAAGVPSIVVRGEDNAAVELIDEGINGFVAPSAAPDDLAAAIVSVYRAGAPLRASTLAWFRRNAAHRRVSRHHESFACGVVIGYGPHGGPTYRETGEREMLLR